ncbi:MAG: amino-acid N-acetyltransferase, partial [Hydrogenophilales bacterium 28-61-11]
MKDTTDFVHWFRSAAPYIHGFRGKTFVIAFGGELVADGAFVQLAHDVNLLNSLGVRLVLIHGVRPQVEARLNENGTAIRYVEGLRVTDDAALACVKEAAGTVRVEIEALLSLGLANTPMAGAGIRVASGNFVTARPLGVRDGVDLLHTGEVRKIDAAAIRRRLDQHDIVLLSPIGYSPTGEIFNLSLEDV